jgi:hypothetical protein
MRVVHVSTVDIMAQNADVHSENDCYFLFLSPHFVGTIGDDVCHERER